MTTDRSEPSYDAVPYTSHAYQQTHPDQLATIARVFGLPSPDPLTARVLEIGCGRGGNIIPMAAACPSAHFLGFDLSRVQVDEAHQTARRLGVDNLEIRHADIADVDESWGEFDYVIAHGVWSWVPRATQDQLLRICRERLGPTGVAYVSYNVYPGWSVRGMVRDLMRHHTRNLSDPGERVRHARIFLEFLGKVQGEQAHTPYAMWLQKEARLLRDQSGSYLLHDHLTETNDPVYFHQFAEQARQHGLSFLGEARLRDMVPPGLSADARQFLDGLPDLLEREQYLDFVVNRTFRSTLLVGEEVDLDRRLDWRSVQDLHLACSGSFEADGPLADPAALGRLQVGKRGSQTRSPVPKAAFSILCEAWPTSRSFHDLLDQARQLVGSPRSTDQDREQLGGVLLTATLHGLVALRATPSPAAPPGPRPRLFGPARIQLEDREELLTSALHGHVRAPADDIRRLLLALDGTRTLEDLTREGHRNAAGLVHQAARQGLLV